VPHSLGLPRKRSCYSTLLKVSLALGLAATAKAQDLFSAFPPQPAGLSSITVFDHQGRFVGRILPEKRYWVSIDHIPPFLQQSLLAVEDARFYEHGGIDLRGIARALVTDVVKGKLAQGGSTITQQLIKNLYLTGEVSLDRKVKEARMAMEFERKYSKRQILEMYFNEIYYGNGAVGLVQAARLYFNKTPEELNEGECIMLAGVPKNPSRYNPAGKPADVSQRRQVVIQRLVALNLITAAQRQALQAHPGTAQGPQQAPGYLAYVRSQLVQRYGPDAVERGGLDVFTAMDLGLQKQAEQVLRDGVKRLAPGLQGALVCLDPTTGDVLAAVGGVDENSKSVNRAFYSKRQPGSAIKPVIYAAALEKGITAGSIWNDTPVAYNRGNGETWKPKNFGNEREGDISLRQALATSNNVVTVKVLDTIGIPYFIDYAAKMGLALKPQNGLSLALGTDEVTLKELAQAYTPLANAGMLAEARAILRIHDRSHDAWTENPSVVTPVMAPAAAFVTTRMLEDVLTYGTAKSLKKYSQSRPTAGKTGTTNDYRDAWFVGYTPQLLAGVWVGYDKPRPGGKNFTGGIAAAPIWERFMVKALASKPVVDFPKPDNVVSISIDAATGFASTAQTSRRRDEFYISGTEPSESGPGSMPAAPASPAPPTASEVPVPEEQIQ